MLVLGEVRSYKQGLLAVGSRGQNALKGGGRFWRPNTQSEIAAAKAQVVATECVLNRQPLGVAQTGIVVVQQFCRPRSQLRLTVHHHIRWSTILMKFISVLTAFACLVSTFATAQVSAPANTRENFMVVVRESIGANRTEDALNPTGKVKAKLADGREVEFEMASWEFIGDTHIRFVFDGPQYMVNATPKDLERLGISGVDDALALALANIKRVYGEPVATPWTGGLVSVEGKSPDLNSSYFLDRAYWVALAKANPEGVVVAVPKRGGLLYTPASNTQAVKGLKLAVGELYSSSQRQRVSSALYLFKDGKWSVFQAAIKQ